MARWILVLLAAGAAAAAQQAPEQPPGELKRERPKAAPGKTTEKPPEEDESYATKKFEFNPLQSEKDVGVGDQYFKQRSYRAALGRYREATQWNERNSRAWLRMGEAAEKLKDPKLAKQAYSKYLELEPEAKNAGDIRKKLGKLK